MEESKVKKLKNELDEFLGDEEKELLKDVILMLRKQDNNLSKAIEAIEQSNLSKTQKKQFKVLTQAVKQIKLEIPKKQDVEVKNLEDIKFPKEVKVNNLVGIIKAIKGIKIPEQKEMPTKIEVTNLKDIPKPPESVDIKKPKWLKQISEEQLDALLDKFLNRLRNGDLKVDLDQYIKARRPLAVRMSDGRKWIEAMGGVVEAMGRGMAFPFINLKGKAQEALVNAKGRLQIDAEIKAPLTAFGEVSVAEPTPVVQVQFPYNINTDIWETRNNNGTSSVSNNMANLSTGAAANQSSVILTKTPVKYNPGQGALARFTALFTTGVANSTQWAGIGNATDGFFFGYSGATFGILRRQGGKPETRRLAITTASNTNEDITITLNGVAETVTVTAAGADSTTTRVITANEIVAHDWSNVGEGWEVHNMGANVFFTSFSAGAKAGTYSLVNGGGEAVGTFAQSLVGVDAIENFIAQTDWNVDKFLGGDDPTILNPTKGNVYQIRYQWLGFGEISFYIEEPFDGGFSLVHRIKYANDNTVPSVDNPTLPLCAIVKNTSNTSDMVMKIGSMAGFVEGRDTLKGLPHSLAVEKTGIGTTETPIMTLHSHDIYQSTINRVKIKMTSGRISVDGTKNSIIRIRKNAVLTGPVAFTPLDSNTSTIHRDTAATGVSGGVVVFAEAAEKIGSVPIDLEKIGAELVAPDFMTITVQTTGGSTVDAIASWNWQELF